MPTNDGYPTDEELERIRSWPVTRPNCGDVMALIAYLKQVFHWPERQIEESDGVDELGRPILVLWLHTGGWSGNEEIIGALKDNYWFWVLYWCEHHKGGHYRFEIPTTMEKR